MIYIDNIKYGWATIHIGHCSFVVSYLSDIVAEIDELLNLDTNEDEISCQKVYLEGESQGDLTLISYLTYEDVSEDDIKKYDYVINILWQRLYCGKQESNSFALLKFPFKELKSKWLKHKKEIKDDYIRNFICPVDEEDLKEYLNNYD